MAIWVNAKTGEQFDDKLAFKPGEEGFTRDLADAWAKTKGFAASIVNYVGTPNWQPLQPAGDQAP